MTEAPKRIWRTIETAPKDGTDILLHWSEGHGLDGSILLAFWSDSGGQDPEHDQWYMYTDDGHGGEPLEGKEATHWQPLPEPPDVA